MGGSLASTLLKKVGAGLFSPSSTTSKPKNPPPLLIPHVFQNNTLQLWLLIHSRWTRARQKVHFERGSLWGRAISFFMRVFAVAALSGVPRLLRRVIGGIADGSRRSSADTQNMGSSAGTGESLA